jgi:YidC/Oxa1 family membrane protein insertase
MTLIIKIVLLPLTHKSYVSMKKMQELNPRMQAIRDRWRPKLKDKKGRPDLDAQRKMNEEINALFKSEGVNPAGGCLPMLLQMPLLFAFYSLLSTSIELRGAPWMGWIHDLSHYDPYYVLPIVMGAAQLVQQRMMPATGDPVQRKIFLLMPVFFTVLFLQFPTGLVLYWLVNNVLTNRPAGDLRALKTRKAATA